jgi:hypothetical protein
MASADIIGTIQGSAQDGGWTASGAVFNDADRLQFYQQLRVWYRLYAAGWEAKLRGAFLGHLTPDPWSKFVQGSEAPFTAKMANEILKDGEVQGIFYLSVSSSPANRHQIILMKYAHIIYELIGGHCNLMHKDEAARYDTTLWGGGGPTTVTFPEGFVRLNLNISSSSAVASYDLKQGNLWGRMQEIAQKDNYMLYVDKTGVLNYQPHPMFAATLPTAVMTLTSAHLSAPLEVTRRSEKIGQVKLEGTTPQGIQIRGKYPTQPTAGPILQRIGYLATSNALMATIAERMYRYENRDTLAIAHLPGAMGLMFDILDRVSVTYTSSADGITWSAKKFWVNKIKVDILSDFTAKSTLELDAEA